MSVQKSIIGKHNVDIPNVKAQACSCLSIRDGSRQLLRKQLPANPSVTTTLDLS